MLAGLRLDVDPQVHVVAAELARVAASLLDNCRVPALFEAEDPKLAHLFSSQPVGDSHRGTKGSRTRALRTERVNA